MNKFNLLARPYSTEQLMGMISKEIAAAEEAYAGVAAAQAELREAEHAFELIHCQYNMLSLVADKPGALEALNVNGAIEAICDKKLADITAEAAVEGLGEKVVEVLKTIWEKIKAFFAKVKEWIVKTINVNKQCKAVLRAAEVFQDDGIKHRMLEKPAIQAVVRQSSALLAVQNILHEALLKITKDQTQAAVEAAVTDANSKIYFAAVPAMALTWISVTKSNRPDVFTKIELVKDVFDKTLVNEKTLTEAGVKTINDVRLLESLTEFETIQANADKASKGETSVAWVAHLNRAAPSDPVDPKATADQKAVVNAYKSGCDLMYGIASIQIALTVGASTLLRAATSCVSKTPAPETK
jgi:hypothetical protein